MALDQNFDPQLARMLATQAGAGSHPAARTLAGLQEALQGHWLDNVYINLQASAVWRMATTQWRSCADFLSAYLVINCDFFSGSGTLTLDVETAPILSMSPGAWKVAGTVTISGTGVQVVKIQRSASVPIMGLLRVQATCNTSAVAATLRADLLLKERVPSRTFEWLQSTYVSFPSSGTQILPADMWMNMHGYLNLWLLVEFRAASGSGANLTVKLQTSPGFSADDNGWADVGTALTMGTSPAVYDARARVTHGPQGVVRLAYVAGAALSGVLRVQALFKDN